MRDVFVPWVPLACLAGAVIVAAPYNRFAPRSARTMASPWWWLFLIVTVMVFGSGAVSSLRS